MRGGEFKLQRCKTFYSVSSWFSTWSVVLQGPRPEQYAEIVYSGVSTLLLEFRKPIRPSKVQKEIELIISIHYDNLGLIQSYLMWSMELRRK